MWLFVRLQRSVSWRRQCSMLELAQHRHAAAKPVPWIKRANKVATQKLISRAKTLAHASSAPPVAGREAGAPSLTGRLMTVPQIQQPQELFNSAMKPVRKLKPRADLRYDQEVASNLVCTMDPSTSHTHVRPVSRARNRRSPKPFHMPQCTSGSKDHGHAHKRNHRPFEDLH